MKETILITSAKSGTCLEIQKKPASPASKKTLT